MTARCVDRRMVEAALPAMGGKSDVSDVLERITAHGESPNGPRLWRNNVPRKPCQSGVGTFPHVGCARLQKQVDRPCTRTPLDETVLFEVAQSLDDPMKSSDGESAHVPAATI